MSEFFCFIESLGPKQALPPHKIMVEPEKRFWINSLAAAKVDAKRWKIFRLKTLIGSF